jgi:phosphoglycerate dehydrogenase-like enzyme
MLAAIRHVVANDQSVRRSEWDRGGAWIGGDLYGATIGLVGLGAIGRMVAQRLSGFDVKIIGHDPVRVDVANVEWSTLGELLRQADVVSLHTPLTPATQGMIGLRELRLMGSDAILINTSRGAIVDEPSLVKALSSGWIRGAGLDVFMNEPPLNSALLEMSNVVLSPHVAGVSVRTQQAMIERAVSSVIDVVAGGASEDAVNPDALTRV